MSNFRAKIADMLADVAYTDDDYPSLITIENAVTFVARLPVGFPQFELALDPDGDISLDWGTAKSIFSLSIGDSQRIPYAMNLCGTSEHGVCSVEEMLAKLAAYKDILVDGVS